ncbi:MAG: hypothetical protein GWN13_08765, partial [Phycisphaerae bacterium]|nr:hypothetical protein [Phycisphaerae bacterium]
MTGNSQGQRRGKDLTLAVLACLLLLSVLPVCAWADAMGSSGPKDAEVRGYLSTRYVARSTRFSGESYSDQD